MSPPPLVDRRPPSVHPDPSNEVAREISKLRQMNDRLHAKVDQQNRRFDGGSFGGRGGGKGGGRGDGGRGRGDGGRNGQDKKQQHGDRKRNFDEKKNGGGKDRGNNYRR